MRAHGRIRRLRLLAGALAAAAFAAGLQHASGAESPVGASASDEQRSAVELEIGEAALSTLLEERVGWIDGTRGVAGFDRLPVFVNMIDRDKRSGYEIGRYDAGLAVESATVSPGLGACDLWSPSAVVRGDEIWLFAAEHDCDGWHRVVLFRSKDGGYTFKRHGVVLETVDQLRMPTVVYHGGRFHLWYTLDRGGLGRALAYADSSGGLQFSPRGVRLWAQDLNAMAVTYAFRLGRQWRLLLAAYNDDLTIARPYLVAFAHPRERYRRVGFVDFEPIAPKMDVALICRDALGRWRGLFSAYGEAGPVFGFEWTMAYTSTSLLGPWRPDSTMRTPYLELSNDGPKSSVENPDVPREDAEPLDCRSSDG